MTMRDDFRRILQNYGHNVYLQRLKEVDECGNEHYSDVLEKHTSRFTIGIHRGLTQAEKEENEGVMNASDRSYYFMHDVRPFEGDLIYDYNDRAPNDQEVWKITSAVGLRGDDGQIVHHICGVVRSRPA